MIKRILIIFIKFYKITISPFFGYSCKFTPTCSQYAIEVLKNAIKQTKKLSEKEGECPEGHKW